MSDTTNVIALAQEAMEGQAAAAQAETAAVEAAAAADTAVVAAEAAIALTETVAAEAEVEAASTVRAMENRVTSCEVQLGEVQTTQAEQMALLLSIQAGLARLETMEAERTNTSGSEDGAGPMEQSTNEQSGNGPIPEVSISAPEGPVESPAVQRRRHSWI